MSDATIFIQGPSTVDCEVLTDIHTPSNLSEVEILSLVQEKLPRYRLRAQTEFIHSNRDFIRIPTIDQSTVDKLTDLQIETFFNHYISTIQHPTSMKKSQDEISTVARMLEDRETDLQMAVSLGQSLLQSNDSLRNQVTLLEQDIEQTTEIVKQLKHDLLLKERLIRFYTDTDLESSTPEDDHSPTHQYEQRIRHLEYENRELRAETMQLKIDSDHFEQQEREIVDHFAHALASANNDLEQLQDALIKKNDENIKQQDEITRLTFEMGDIHRRLNELKKENDELKHLLSLTGKTRHEYEAKIDDLERNYGECLAKLRQSQNEIQSLEQLIKENSLSTPTADEHFHRHTVFLSPIDYANYMSLENSLQTEFEEVLEDRTRNSFQRKSSRRRQRRQHRDSNETDGESSINDSAFSDTESLSSASSCRTCQRSSPIPIVQPTTTTTTTNDRKISSRLRLVKRLEGSHMLKRWQELAEPSFSSCLQPMPGVYTRAEILQDVKEENEDDGNLSDQESEERISFSMEKYSPETPKHPPTTGRRMNLVELLTKHGLTARTLEPSKEISEFEKKFLTCPLPNRLRRASMVSTVTSLADEIHDDLDEEPTTPPSSPIHGSQLQTGALLHQVIQRLVNLSRRTFESLAISLSSPTNDEKCEESPRQILTITPPSSPTFDGLTAPTPNTTMRAMKTSTFLRVSSFNPFANQSIRNAFVSQTSPGEIPLVVDELLRGRVPRI